MVTMIIVLAVVIAAAIGMSLIADAIRKKDFNDQVSGKKPERKAPANHKISYDKPQSENPQIEADREGLRMKSGQNLTGI